MKKQGKRERNFWNTIFYYAHLASCIIYSSRNQNQKKMLLHARSKEKNSEGAEGATKYELLSATIVGWQRKFLISNRLKRLENLNICRRQVV